jgi:hypothetical protein
MVQRTCDQGLSAPGQIFFCSYASGIPAVLYQWFVALAFEFAKTVLIVISKESVQSKWPRTEAEWTFYSDQCLKDGTFVDLLHADLVHNRKERGLPLVLIDFASHGQAADEELKALLDTPTLIKRFVEGE